MLGFVGSPWTLATYIIEGSSSGLYKTIKTMIHGNPDLLSALLSHLAEQIATYSCYQIQSGAQCIQLFDSWGGQLPPQVSNTLCHPIEQHGSCRIPWIALLLLKLMKCTVDIRSKAVKKARHDRICEPRRLLESEFSSRFLCTSSSHRF